MKESTQLTERIRKLIQTCNRIDQLPAARKMIANAERSGHIPSDVADYLDDLAEDWEEKFYSQKGEHDNGGS